MGSRTEKITYQENKAADFIFTGSTQFICDIPFYRQLLNKIFRQAK